MMKKILIGLAGFLILAGIAFYITSKPTATEDGAYSPSPLAIKLATSSVTDYDNTTFPNPYTGNKKILMAVSYTHLTLPTICSV